MNRLAKTRRLRLEELESRFLLSADMAPAVAGELPFPETAVHQAVADALPAAAPVVPSRFELVFIDAAVPDHAHLVAEIEAQNDGWRHIEVVVLDPQRDGIAQMSEVLARRVQLDAVHFVSHGADGKLQLGATLFDAAVLADREATVAGWGASLKAGGDLIFYGCDLAATAHGEAFLARIAALAGADVAASANLTGADALGGDWRLEFTLGIVESEIVVSGLVQAAWNGVLATQTLDWDAVPVAPLAETGAGTNTYSTTYSVAGGTVTVTIADPADRLRPNGSPEISTAITGGLAAPIGSLRIQSDGFQPGESVIVTISFAGFAGGVSNIGLLLFDIDTADDGANFVDRVVFGANNGAAVDPTAITTGPGASLAAGLGAAAVENAWSYSSPIGADTVEGRWTGNDPIPIADDPNQEDNSPNNRSNGNAYVVFGQSGITTVTLTYSNAPGRTASPQGIALHDIAFDPTPSVGGDAYAVAEDSALVVPALTGVLANDADPAGDALTALLVAGPANGVLALSADGGFAYTPEPDFFGIDTFTYRASDGVALSTIASVTLTVSPVNDAPVLAGANAPAGIDEDDATSAGTLVSALIAGQVSDADPGALTGIAVTAVDDLNGAWQYSLDGGGAWVAFGAPAPAAARLLAADALTRVRFVPNADWSGVATIDFRAWDRTGGVAGGTGDTTTYGDATAFSTASTSAGIAVSAVGDTVNDAVAADADNAVAVNVLANDTFENAGRVLTGVSGATNGTVAFDASGLVTYTPYADWSGTETLTYTVTSGGATETGTLTITVSAVSGIPAFTPGVNQAVNERPAPQTVVGVAAGSSAGDSLAFPNLNAVSPILRALGGFDALVLPEPPVLAVPARVAIAPGDPGFARIDPQVEYEPLEVLRLPGPEIALAFDRPEFDDFVGRGAIDVLMDGVKMAGLVLSVGVLWWATRAAGLLASALAALPAWHNFDPIFVVGRDDDEKIEWRRMDEEAEREEAAVGQTLEVARDDRIGLRQRSPG